MGIVTLGKTNIAVEKNAFGALPIQRCSEEVAVKLLQSAYENGINFFDTARAYSDSEYKMGKALAHVRENIIIATKTGAKTPDEFWSHLNESLTLLKTDYIDIYQFHNHPVMPQPGDGTGLYECMLEAKKQGKIRFIGMTNHRHNVAMQIAESGLYDTLQYPFSYLASEKDEQLVNLCKENNVGFICMKALSGGLITNSAAAYAYLNKFENVLPIWGVQKQSELDEFISYIEKPPQMTEDIEAFIEKERESLSGSFCRGCGYCCPCPQGIEIFTCARVSLLIRRSPENFHTTPEWQDKIRKIEKCTQCGMCKAKCPYSLDIPKLLRKNYEDYKTFI